MRRGFSRIRRQIGKLRGSQMSLIGAETCRMNAACALGLCVAGLRGQLRKLPFGVCTPRRLGPTPSRGSSWLGGLIWGRVSRSQILRIRGSRLRFLRVGRQAFVIAALRLGGTRWPDAAFASVYRYTRLISLLGLRRLKPSRMPCTRWW